MTKDPKNEYAQAVCYFIAEQLRVRKISLKRAAEIAQKVIENINLIDSEQDFLRLIKTLASDFEELTGLTNRIQFSISINQRKDLETKVREFAAGCLPHDPHLALCVLEEAVKDNVGFNDLCGKFPEFQQFVSKQKSDERAY